MPSPHGKIPNSIFAGGQNIFGTLVPLWAGKKPLSGGVSGCSDKCTAQLTAPALAATTCVEYQNAVDYNSKFSIQNAFGTTYAPPVTHESFVIATALDVSGVREKINAILAYAPSTDCIGNITYIVCSLESAVGEYNITVEDNQITIDSAANPRIVGIANNSLVSRTPGSNGYQASTLAAVVQAANLIWVSTVVTTKVNGSATVSGNGAHADLWFQRGTYNEAECPAYRDPREEYMASLNRWMVSYRPIFSAWPIRPRNHSLRPIPRNADSIILQVYMGLAAAQGIANPRLDTLDAGLQINATTTGHVTGARSVFDTHYAFFAGAAAVELICICLIAPTCKFRHTTNI